jgi:lambda family phage tail tape measure protein
LEKERTDELTELNELTLISAEQRAQKEAEINQIYDQRIDKLNTTQDILDAIADAGTKFDITEATRNNIDNLMYDIMRINDLNEANSLQQRERIQKEYDLQSELQSKFEELQTKINKDIAEQKAKIGRELTGDEIKLIHEKYEVERQGLSEAQDLYNTYGSNVLDLYDKLIAKSREFGTGIKESFLSIRDFVENQAAYAGRIIDTMAQGFEDAILNFVETGKLSFKDLFKSLLAEIIKMQANRMFLALFSPEGGLFGNLFAGMFANGGIIPGGKIGIVGERGPELIRGPASVTSTADTAALLSGGSTQVTYNIQAIDSRSFEERLAERPEFIYAVTEAGRRRSPGGRL